MIFLRRTAQSSRADFVYFPLAAVVYLILFYFRRANWQNGAHAAGSINMRQKKETQCYCRGLAPPKSGDLSDRRGIFTFFAFGFV